MPSNLLKNRLKQLLSIKTKKYQNKKIPKQHDLLKLKNLINDVLNIEDNDILDSMNTLYIDSRYPGDLGLLPYGQPTLDDAKEFYSLALRIFKDVANMLELDIKADK